MPISWTLSNENVHKFIYARLKSLQLYLEWFFQKTNFETDAEIPLLCRYTECPPLLPKRTRGVHVNLAHVGSRAHET
jgi:hypothetical protein